MKVLQNPQASLNGLPEELVLHIIDSLPGPGIYYKRAEVPPGVPSWRVDNRSVLRSVRGDIPSEQFAKIRCLHNLCLTSRKLCRIARPRLYHDFNAELYSDEAPAAFVRSLVTIPDLAADVEMLSWRLLPADSQTPSSTLRAILSETDLREICRVEESRGDGHDLHTASPLEELHPLTDTCLCEVLKLTTNLKHLVVLDELEWSQQRVWVLPFDSLEGSQKFELLTSAHIEARALRLKSVSPLLLHSSLRRLWLGGLVDAYPEWQDNTYPRDLETMKGASSVEHLTMPYSCVSARLLASLLPVFQGLKTFIYEHSQERGWSYRRLLGLIRLKPAVFEYPMIARALQTQSNSLQRVRLWHSDSHRDSYQSYLVDHFSSSKPLGSLREFTQLESLDLPIYSFLDVNNPDVERCAGLLPPNLRRLEISFHDESTVSECPAMPLLEALAKAPCNSVPKLDTVAIGQSTFTIDTVPDWDKLREMYEQAGMILKLPPAHINLE